LATIAGELEDAGRGPEAASPTNAPSAARVAQFIAATIFLYVMVGVFNGEKMSYLLKDQLHLSADGMATFGLIAGFPGYIRPFLGAGADIFPLFGFHRRSYYAISWALVAAANLAVAFLPVYHYNTIFALIVLGGVGGNLLLVIVDAVMVAVGNQTGTIGRLQTIQQGLQLVMGLTFASVLRGYVTQHWSYRACFLASAAVAVLAIPLMLMIQERRVVHARQEHETEQAHALRTAERMAEQARISAALKDALKSPGLWAMVAFVFYLIITPGTNTAQFYYLVNVLHVSKQFIGNIGVPGAAGAIVGLAAFAFASRRLPVRAMVWGAYLMDCALYLVSFGIHNESSTVVVVFFLSLLGVIYNLCLLTLAARTCPPGVEGTIYGLVMSAIALAGAFGEKIGASLYDHFGPATHHTVTYGWHGLLWTGFAFTVVAAVFIPFLPAWSRSNEPLHPRAAIESVTADA
jgi:MFS family permease